MTQEDENMMIDDSRYDQGYRNAMTRILGECIMALDYNDDPVAGQARWILEHEAAIAQLRIICAECGDNEWDPTMHLADIIEKHLGKWLLAPGESDESVPIPDDIQSQIDAVLKERGFILSDGKLMKHPSKPQDASP